MKKNKMTSYDIDCEVRKELNMKIVPRDCFHGDFVLKDSEIEQFRIEWKNFMIHARNILEGKEDSSDGIN